MYSVNEMMMLIRIDVRYRVNSRYIDVTADRVDGSFNRPVEGVYYAEVSKTRKYFSRLKASSRIASYREPPKIASLTGNALVDCHKHLALRTTSLRAGIECN